MAHDPIAPRAIHLTAADALDDALRLLDHVRSESWVDGRVQPVFDAALDAIEEAKTLIRNGNP